MAEAEDEVLSAATNKRSRSQVEKEALDENGSYALIDAYPGKYRAFVLTTIRRGIFLRR